jgi:hypothetical protein
MEEKQLERPVPHEQPALIKFLDSSDKREYLHRTRVAEYRHKELQARENTIRGLIAGLWSLIIAGFIYAGLTQDSALPKTLVTVSITAVGGVKALKHYEARKR